LLRLPASGVNKTPPLVETSGALPPAQHTEQNMRTNNVTQSGQPAANGQPLTREDRINAGYLRLLRAILKGRRSKAEVRSAATAGQRGVRLKASAHRPAVLDYLARFLCFGCACALLATGCAGPRPLKAGRAVLVRKPTGLVEQTVVQSENPAQTTRQDQQSLKVRSYTVPPGSRLEPSPTPSRAAAATPASAVVPQPSPACVLSAPMPVVEREETRARTELGAAQKDTTRELGAKLASLKGIVWVGVGLFVFGLASLVWPPLKAVLGSVTTSAALMLGGVALTVLPTMVVGNEPLILGVVTLAVGGWFLAHRHGELRGIVAAANGKPKPVARSRRA
jgi:hypothetical protein